MTHFPYQLQVYLPMLAPPPPGGRTSHMKGVGRKFWIKPLKETDLGVAQAFFDP